VVVAHAVSMMHSFIGEEMPAKSLLHHEDVLEDVVARPRAGVAGGSNHDVTGLVPCPASLPVSVGLCLVFPTCAARAGFELLSVPAIALVLGTTGRAAKVAT